MSRLPRVVFTVLLAAAAAVPVVGVVLEPAALADEGDDVAVGTELMATSDVTLHQAEIAKGSRVSVTKILARDGRVDGVSVALADGHVVKITATQMHTFFRVVRD